MVDVTQSIALEPTPKNWQRPPEPYIGPIPFGQIVFTSDTDWDAIGASDEQLIVYSGTLSAGYYYRLMDARVLCRSTAENQLDNYSYGMHLFFTENQVTTPKHDHVLWNRSQSQIGSVSNFAGFIFDFSGETNTSMTQFTPAPGENLSANLIDASKGVSICRLEIVSAETVTNIVQANVYIRLLQYTIEQAEAGVIYATYPTYGS